VAEELVTVQLKISPTGRTVLADVTFKNKGKTDVFLWKVVACVDGELENDFFEIRRGDQRVDYTGILAKYGDLQASDFIKLEPGKQLEVRIHLEKYYDFPAGSGDYRAKFKASNPYPDRDDDFDLASNEEKFHLSP